MLVGGADELQLGDLAAPLGALAALYTPMLMMFWFAPPLAAWHGVGAAKSLFFSLVACVMNWRAFLLYGLVTLAAIVMVAGALRLIMALAPGDVPRGVPLPVLLLVVVLLLPTFFASFYASYRDVFGAEAKTP
jgi:ABC-type xylose transport system permease subunit